VIAQHQRCREVLRALFTPLFPQAEPLTARRNEDWS